MSELYSAPLPSVRARLQRQPSDVEKQDAKLSTVQRSHLAGKTCRPGDPLCSPSTVLNRSLASASSASNSLLRLQRQIGNRHVQRVVTLARQAHGETEVVSPSVQRAIDGARGGGQSLDSGVRRQMGRAFNADFSGVRVHTDAHADGLNRTLNARAFTTGRDVFFRRGEYDPSSANGRSLLAHELTHVMQQNPGVQSNGATMISPSSCNCRSGDGGQNPVQTKLTVSRPGDVYEKEADSMAQAYTHWESSRRAQTAEGGLQRKKPEEDDEMKKQMVRRQETHDGMLHRQADEELEEGMLAKAESDGVQRQEAEEPEEM